MEGVLFFIIIIRAVLLGRYGTESESELTLMPESTSLSEIELCGSKPLKDP